MSIGVERIYSLLLKKIKLDSVKAAATQVFVCGIADGTLIERMKICKELWDAGISATYQYKADKLKLAKQFKKCEDDQIPIAVVIGSGEIERGVIGIKDQRSTGSKQIEVKREVMIEKLLEMLR